MGQAGRGYGAFRWRTICHRTTTWILILCCLLENTTASSNKVSKPSNHQLLQELTKSELKLLAQLVHLKGEESRISYDELKPKLPISPLSKINQVTPENPRSNSHRTLGRHFSHNHIKNKDYLPFGSRLPAEHRGTNSHHTASPAYSQGPDMASYLDIPDERVNTKYQQHKYENNGALPTVNYAPPPPKYVRPPVRYEPPPPPVRYKPPPPPVRYEPPPPPVRYEPPPPPPIQSTHPGRFQGPAIPIPPANNQYHSESPIRVKKVRPGAFGHDQRPHDYRPHHPQTIDDSPIHYDEVSHPPRPVQRRPKFNIITPAPKARYVNTHGPSKHTLVYEVTMKPPDDVHYHPEKAYPVSPPHTPVPLRPITPAYEPHYSSPPSVPAPIYRSQYQSSNPQYNPPNAHSKPVAQQSYKRPPPLYNPPPDTYYTPASHDLKTHHYDESLPEYTDEPPKKSPDHYHEPSSYQYNSPKYPESDHYDTYHPEPDHHEHEPEPVPQDVKHHYRKPLPEIRDYSRQPSDNPPMYRYENGVYIRNSQPYRVLPPDVPVYRSKPILRAPPDRAYGLPPFDSDPERPHFQDTRSMFMPLELEFEKHFLEFSKQMEGLQHSLEINH